MNWGPLGDEKDKDTHKIKWYYCFFELNNGRIIHSQFEEGLYLIAYNFPHYL